MWIKHFCIVTLFESLNWYSSRLSSCLAGHNVDYYRRGVEDYTCIQYSGVTREGGGGGWEFVQIRGETLGEGGYVLECDFNVLIMRASYISPPT